MAAELRLERGQDGIALLTLCRPRRLNALTWELIDELHETLAGIARDSQIQVLIVTGEGRGFCAGLDIQDEDPLGTRDPVALVYERQEKVAALALALRDLPQPVLAAVNGPAAGGGLALALAADVRVCAQSALFAVAFVRVGLSGCDVGVSYLLPRIVGAGIASELMLTGRRVDAAEAERIGLANRVVDDAQLLAQARELAGQIARNSQFGVRMTKQVLRRNLDAGSLEAAIELENRTQVLATRTPGPSAALAALGIGEGHRA